MKYYIKKGLKRAAIFATELKEVGTTEEDYKSGKWVEVNELQADFYKENPHASLSEIIAMELIPQKVYEVPIEERYANLVASKIAERYSFSAEMAILRKREVEPTKFNEYNDFCEQCKIEAKKELGLWKEEDHI